MRVVGSERRRHLCRLVVSAGPCQQQGRLPCSGRGPPSRTQHSSELGLRGARLQPGSDRRVLLLHILPQHVLEQRQQAGQHRHVSKAGGCPCQPAAARKRCLQLRKRCLKLEPLRGALLRSRGSGAGQAPRRCSCLDAACHGQPGVDGGCRLGRVQAAGTAGGCNCSRGGGAPSSQKQSSTAPREVGNSKTLALQDIGIGESPGGAAWIACQV